jgi:hypothetical protein
LILEKLENQHPGITKVDRGYDGAINLPDMEDDLETLLKEIDSEVERSKHFFTGRTG